MWQPVSHHLFTRPVAGHVIPSRHGIARQAYLDRKRAQGERDGRNVFRFRWLRRLVSAP